jgi:hypothetical protein
MTVPPKKGSLARKAILEENTPRPQGSRGEFIMLKRTKTPGPIFGIVLAMTLWMGVVSISPVFGQGGPGGGPGMPGSGRPSSPADYYRGSVPPPQQAVLTPHCGQYLTTRSNCFELVFTMSQARIYVFDKARNPQSMRDIQVQMSLRVPGERENVRAPFQYVAMPPGIADQDYVAATFNFALLRDKETPITIDFSNLPDHHQPTVSFTPMFSVGKVRPYVALVVLAESDRAGIGRQRVCPVDGELLGNKGLIVKVLLGEQPLYLCCKECMAAVRKTPEKYLPAAQLPAGQLPAAQVPAIGQ